MLYRLKVYLDLDAESDGVTLDQAFDAVRDLIGHEVDDGDGLTFVVRKCDIHVTDWGYPLPDRP